MNEKEGKPFQLSAGNHTRIVKRNSSYLFSKMQDKFIDTRMERRLANA